MSGSVQPSESLSRGPFLEPAPAPLERSLPSRYSTRTLPGLPFDPFDNVTSYLDCRDKHFLKLTCRSISGPMSEIGVLELDWCQERLYRIAKQINDGRPELAEIVAKIRAIIPPNFRELPRTGLFHPLLSRDQRWETAKLKLHDALTGRKAMTGAPNANSFTFFLRVLQNSLPSWDLIKTLMEMFGPWAFHMAAPELQNDKNCILEAANYGRQVLRYVIPDTLTDHLLDEHFTSELLGRLACHKPSLLLPQAIFALCHHGRCLSIASSGDQLADARSIAIITRPRLMPHLHNDNGLIPMFINGKWITILLSQAGTRTEDRTQMYSTWRNLVNEDVTNSLRFDEEVNVALRNARKKADYPAWFASCARDRDFDINALCYASETDLTPDFWKAVLDQPFAIDAMIRLARCLRHGDVDVDPDEIDFIVDEEIVFRFILYFLHMENHSIPSADPDRLDWFSVLYPYTRFIEEPLFWRVYSSLTTKKHRVALFVALLGYKLERGTILEIREEQLMFNNIFWWGLHIKPEMRAMWLQDPKVPVAFILATVLESKEMGTQEAREKLIGDIFFVGGNDEMTIRPLHDAASHLPGVTTSPPPAPPTGPTPPLPAPATPPPP